MLYPFPFPIGFHFLFYFIFELFVPNLAFKRGMGKAKIWRSQTLCMNSFAFSSYLFIIVLSHIFFMNNIFKKYALNSKSHTNRYKTSLYCGNWRSVPYFHYCLTPYFSEITNRPKNLNITNLLQIFNNHKLSPDFPQN